MARLAQLPAAGLFLLLLPAFGQRSISLDSLRDKIAGGWAGQMIGVSFGAPTEFRYLKRIIPVPELPKWEPSMIANALNQDDLYVDMTLAKVLDDKGLDATTADFAAMFRNAEYSLWHANLAARRALKRGVAPNEAGTPAHNAHYADIDFQIESDFAGLMAPGLPRAAVDIAGRAGRVMNSGDGIYGGIFVSGMYAAAYFENNPRRVVEAGLACLPARSRYARVIADVLAWSKQTPDDWEAVWRKLEEKWDPEEPPCPEGALRPFNIDAALNGAYIALGLLHGGADFGKTIEISTRAGQDSDCNPSSAAGILGVMLGYKAIPEHWKVGLEAIADRKFAYTEFTFRTIVGSTEKRAIALAQRFGGRLEGGRLVVPAQRIQAAPLETAPVAGKPVERILTTDSRWQFEGDWTREAGTGRQSDGMIRTATKRGAAAEVSFEGTGAMLVGPLLPTGGKADVYLDGKLHRTVDSYSDEPRRKHNEAVWHVFGLAPGRHAVRVVVRGETILDSPGTEVAISDLVVIR